MTGGAVDPYVESDPGDRAGHDGGRQPGLGEDRTLFDVYLEVGGRRPHRPALSDRGADRGDRFGERHTVGVRQRQLLGTQASDQRPGAVAAKAESRSLLISPGDHRGAKRPRTEQLDRLQRDQHAQRAVVEAAAGHRVEVRSTPDLGGAGDRAGPSAVEVAGRIPEDHQSGIAHPTGDELVGGRLGQRPATAVDLPASQRAEHPQPVLDSGSGHGDVG